MELHEKLIHLRKQKGLSQLKVAEALDVSRQAVSKWEVGAAVPSIENLRSLSNLYGVPIDFFVGDKDDIERPSEECDITDMPVNLNDPGNVPSSHKLGFGNVFVGIAIVWICVLVFGFFRKAIYAAIFFVIDSAVLLGAIYLFYWLIIFIRRKCK